MADFTIRPVRREDAAEIVAIMRDLGWFQWPETAAESEARVTSLIRAYFDDNPNRLTLVVETDTGTVAAFICVHWLLGLTSLEGYISHLFVAASARGQGLGRQLLGTVEAEARSRGCTRLMLYARYHREVYQRGFYQQNGWQEQADAALFMKWLAR